LPTQSCSKLRSCSDGAAALNYTDQNADQRNNQKNVDEPAHGIRAHHAEQPQNNQNYRDCIKHRKTLLGSVSVLGRCAELCN
jgi:hypothetical protein